MASSDQSSVGCGFNASFIFKTSQVCPLYAPPSVQSGTQSLVYSLVQFSKSLVCWLESDAQMHSSGVSLEVHKQIYGVTFLSSSCFPILSSPLGFSFSVLWRESWGFSYHILPLVSWTVPKSEAKKHQGREREKKSNQISHHPLGITVPLIREVGFLSSVLGA